MVTVADAVPTRKGLSKIEDLINMGRKWWKLATIVILLSSH
jgi:hypothetical protein